MFLFLSIGQLSIHKIYQKKFFSCIDKFSYLGQEWILWSLVSSTMLDRSGTMLKDFWRRTGIPSGKEGLVSSILQDRTGKMLKDSWRRTGIPSGKEGLVSSILQDRTGKMLKDSWRRTGIPSGKEGLVSSILRTGLVQ